MSINEQNSKISIVIPLFNEAENLPILIQRILDTLEPSEYNFEIILVNDGSLDATAKVALDLIKRNDSITLINLKRNFGQTAAMRAGIEKASGDIIIPIDGDLQNDPKDIPRLIEKLNQGFDVVSGWRKRRKDNRFIRNFPSYLANKLISWISGVKLHDYGCTLKAYRSHVLKDVQLYGEMHRFIPIYASWQGGKVTELEVEHHPRVHGESSYGLERVFKVILDLIVVRFLQRSLTKPIYTFGGFGLLNIIFGFALGIFSIYLKIYKNISLIQTPLPLLTVMLIIVGIGSVLLGLLAEIIVRTYFESQGKPTYLVDEVIDFEALDQT